MRPPVYSNGKRLIVTEFDSKNIVRFQNLLSRPNIEIRNTQYVNLSIFALKLQ